MTYSHRSYWSHAPPDTCPVRLCSLILVCDNTPHAISIQLSTLTLLIFMLFLKLNCNDPSIYLSICQRLLCQIFFDKYFYRSVCLLINHGFSESEMWPQTQLKTCSCRNSETPFTLFVYSPTLQTQSHHSAQINHHIRDPWNCQLLR